MEETRLRTNAKKTPSYDVENDQINTMHSSAEPQGKNLFHKKKRKMP